MRRRRVAPDMSPLAPEPQQPGRILDARLHLLDRQVLDLDDVPVCTLDDLELEAVADPAADPAVDGSSRVVVTALLTGPVLGTRVFGGRPPFSRWHRLPWRDVLDIGTAVHLAVRGEGLDATWLERWTRDHIIARVPGGLHDPESAG
ncbi:hypothetical protein ACQEVI_03535 [Promicromonospora sp. CA-289599]|uniref:hypothetical protein n=1 Tax=Promicromonospora sp. CA-289599 TaxID=3240014 RepID=UPI003D8C3E1E